MPRLEVVLQTQPLEQAGRPIPQTPPHDCLFSRAERASLEVVGAAATVATRPKTVARTETAGRVLVRLWDCEDRPETYSAW